MQQNKKVNLRALRPDPLPAFAPQAEDIKACRRRNALPAGRRSAYRASGAEIHIRRPGTPYPHRFACRCDGHAPATGENAPKPLPCRNRRSWLPSAFLCGADLDCHHDLASNRLGAHRDRPLGIRRVLPVAQAGGMPLNRSRRPPKAKGPKAVAPCVVCRLRLAR
jgi:hypothetical protein